MYTVLFKETGYKIYIQWVPPLVIFLSLITVKLICSFLISILIPIQLLAKGFITRRFHRDLGLKMWKKADVPVYAEGTESSGIGRCFPKQEVTGLKFTNYIYLIALQT
jgi:hypothetical protein